MKIYTSPLTSAGELGIRYTTKLEHKFLHARGRSGLGYATAKQGGDGQATEALVSSFTRWNYYSFPGVRQELAVIARLQASSPWSPPVVFNQEAFQATDGPGQRRRADDAAETVRERSCLRSGRGSLELLVRHYELRLSCPNWLVDRSGFLEPQKLEVQYRGRLLPSYNGLTLLHAECADAPEFQRRAVAVAQGRLRVSAVTRGLGGGMAARSPVVIG
eukprot:Skav232919  [mRNA]  locus=scaffold1477:767304:775077:- [translate_table: standard]